MPLDDEVYGKKAREYMEAQKRFYAGKNDESRVELYSRLGDLRCKRVLDAGCGFGEDLAYFHSQGAEVFGIDASEQMVELAREMNPGIANVSVQRYDNTGFEGNFFDTVYSRYALHYSDDLTATFREFHRILKPGGELVFLVAHPLLGFVGKKEKDYHKREMVEIPIYGGEFTVIEPTRTFSEYINGTVLGMFELVDLFENPGGDNASKENCMKETVPDYMIVKLRKR